MMTLTAADLRESRGYHPVATDATDVIRLAQFDEVLVLGPGVPDVADEVDDVRWIPTPEVDLPTGVYWYTDVDTTVALVVNRGAAPGASVLDNTRGGHVDDGLEGALQWVDHLWASGSPVPTPKFQQMDDVLTSSDGADGLVRSRQFVSGTWVYTVYSGSRTQKVREDALAPRPVADAPEAWVKSQPESAGRFAATLTRAKLSGQFTDTVYSFRATRTVFRPYQFKPVMKLLNTGSLRLLIADEVGLGKTIEAGLLWTELEARRKADRVLVVCPSSLSAKWRREMEERFGFELVELTSAGLRELRDRLESDRVPKRAAYLCTVERLRSWDAISEATELGLQFDLVIADEAHVFRNSSTKSHALGEQLSQWADALVFLSATPVNLRNNDLFNLLDILVPGEFYDLESLEERIAPNATIHKITSSLLDDGISNHQRRTWLRELDNTAVGRVLATRPDFEILEEILGHDVLSAADAVKIKRICSELHGLSSQVTRTRKVEVQTDKVQRNPRPTSVMWSSREHAFYQAFYDWCVQRANAKEMPLNFAMQMPLRLAGSCLPEAAKYVLGWSESARVGAEVDNAAEERPGVSGPDVPPSRELLTLASELDVDTKLQQFDSVISEVLSLGRQALIFTFSRRTLAYVQRFLASRCRVAALHGGIGRDERDATMARFRAGEYDIVVATKVASEGLDFEFCSVLVNYDLPWNPMEIEQRIGRLDRIGQREETIQIFNFTTPGTIETDILEKVLDRIEIFRHAIGALEPIIDSMWRGLETELLDFNLTEEQRARRTQETLLAVEEQRQALQEIESAAPTLVSSDGVDIDGLEPDLLASGNYVGQEELALLVTDWSAHYEGRVTRTRDVLTLTGNQELADHVTKLARAGLRTSAEVQELAAKLRNEDPIHVSLDQEESRIAGMPLLTSTHPLVRAAVEMPSHRQSRFATASIARVPDGAPPGTYFVQMCVASWDGVRPLHEVWAAAVETSTGRIEPMLGQQVMAALAAGTLRPASREADLDLDQALAVASNELAGRSIDRDDELRRENEAFVAMRRVSAEQVHHRRMESLSSRIANMRAEGKATGTRLFSDQLDREKDRHRAFLAELDRKFSPVLTTEDLAVCVVEVV